MAGVKHPVTFRTRKLSLLAPVVLCLKTWERGSLPANFILLSVISFVDAVVSWMYTGHGVYLISVLKAFSHVSSTTSCFRRNKEEISYLPTSLCPRSSLLHSTILIMLQ